MEENRNLSNRCDENSEAELIEAINQGDRLDEEQKRSVIERITATQVSHFSGPLPHPDILERYASIRPDFPERILVMAEREQEAQIANAATAIRAETTGLTFVAISFAITPIASIVAMIVGAIFDVEAAIWAGLFGTFISMTPQVLSKIRRADD